MLSADQIPINNTRTKTLWHKWVRLIPARPVLHDLELPFPTGIANRGGERTRGQRPDTWNGRQSPACFVATVPDHDLPIEIEDLHQLLVVLIDEMSERPANGRRDASIGFIANSVNQPLQPQSFNRRDDTKLNHMRVSCRPIGCDA
jgi:hypothetical protein